MYLYQKMKSRLIHCEDPMNCLCLLGNSAWLGWGKMFPEAFFPSPVAGWRIKFFLHAVFKHIMDLLSSLEAGIDLSPLDMLQPVTVKLC